MPADCAATLIVSITLATGDAVSWSESPDGIAQVAELRRKNVVIGFKDAGGRWRRRTVPVAKICKARLLFEMKNPYDRGLVARSKTYLVGEGRPAESQGR